MHSKLWNIQKIIEIITHYENYYNELGISSGYTKYIYNFKCIF